MADLFDQTWAAVPGNVPLARHAVLRHLAAKDIPEPPLNDIGLALSEAVTNVVNHAYVDRDPGEMRVCVEVGPQEVEITVQDSGSGMVPRPDSPGLGLGMPLIATVSDRFDVRARSGGGTRLCIWFSKQPAASTLN